MFIQKQKLEMKTFLTIAILGLLSAAYIGCTSQKKSNNMGEQVQIDMNKMKADGFTSGKIIASSEESACPFTIDLDDENYSYLLDPINLEDAFKKDGLMIWVKFSALRMQNRCDNANPVNISEIKIKEN